MSFGNLDPFSVNSILSCKVSNTYSKTCVNGHSKKDRTLVFKTNHRLMQDEMLLGEHSAILSIIIKLPFVSKIFVLSIF